MGSISPSGAPAEHFDAHRMLARYGLEGGRKRAANKLERVCLEAAATMIESGAGSADIGYASPLVSALPYREPDVEMWERDIGAARYTLTGAHLRSGERIGIPFGAKARALLIEVHTAAMRSDGPLLETGFSRHAYMKHMGLSGGGMTYKSFIDQWCRMATCHFAIDTPGEVGWSGSLVRHFIHDSEWSAPPIDDRTATLTSTAISLDPAFFGWLRHNHVRLSLPAVRLIGDNGWAIDLYIWLAHVLPMLREPALFEWRTLEAMFSAPYRRRRQIRHSLMRALPLVKAIYRDAAIEWEAGGLRLNPAAPPI